MVGDTSDTIAAIASAAGGAYRGIIRLAGEHSVALVQQVFEPDESQPELADLSVATRLPGTMDLGPPLGIVPADLLVWPGQRSYTRQPAAEIHTIGSPPLLEAILARLCRAGARIARPGEFTLRSFLAGRIDLTQAEAVLGVIDARNQRDLNVALSQLAGGLAAPLSALRDQLLDLLAHLEAGLDFADEDIEFIARDELQRQLDAAAAQIDALAEQMLSRGLARSLVRVVLRGEPNAGKSSLFNALCGTASAIVSQVPGTTRDYVSARMLCGGEIELIDTAGVDQRAAEGSIAAAAQDLACAQAEQAALALLCVDASRPLTGWERQELAVCREEASGLVVWTKCDAARGDSLAASGEVRTSSHTGQGIAELKNSIETRLAEQSADSAVVPGTAARCRESLELAAQSLRRARAAAAESGEEFAAAEVRSALHDLGQVVGAVYTDDVLDRIFSRFCIGK